MHYVTLIDLHKDTRRRLFAGRPGLATPQGERHERRMALGIALAALAGALALLVLRH